MKGLRLLSVLLVLCLLIGCSNPPGDHSVGSSGATSSEEAVSPPSGGASSDAPSVPPTGSSSQDSPIEPVNQFTFTRENFPRLNGSTSTVPLGKAIASVLLGETQEEVGDLIQFSKTTASYRQLMNGFADLLIAAEPAAVIWDEKAAQNFEWEMAPFAVDGLVFVVNAGNPVDSLTTEQVQKIYTGEITNWSQVGGEDLEIVPFQRNAEAGSQTAMLKLVMGDLPMMNAPAEYVRGEMGDLIEAVAAYDGTAAAIGYTVYYYANDMKMADGLKIIAIDGVSPCDETIRSGAYPFLNNYYTLIAAGLPEDAPAKVMYDWLLSEDGQRLVANQGYVSVLDVPSSPPGSTAPTSPVYADWSKLAASDSPVPLYSWYEPRSADGLLQPRDDYGTLLKFVGTISSVRYLVDRLPLYGLVTADGRVVTEPVYADISFYGDHFLVLLQGEVTDYRETEGIREPVGSFHYTVAAADGSWTLDVGLCDLWPVLSSEDQIAIPRSDGSVVVINADGTIAADFPRSALEACLGADFQWVWDIGPLLASENGALLIRQAGYNWEPEKFFLHMDTGTVSDIPPEGWEPYDYENWSPTPEPEPPQAPHKLGYAFLDPVTDSVTGTLYFYGYHREFKRYDLLNADGTPAFLGCNLYEPGATENYILRAGLLAFAEDSLFCYRSLETGETVFRWPIRSNSD